VSDSSDTEEQVMTVVGWRDKHPYLTPTKQRKKRNERKGVKRPTTPK